MIPSLVFKNNIIIRIKVLIYIICISSYVEASLEPKNTMIKSNTKSETNEKNIKASTNIDQNTQVSTLYGTELNDSNINSTESDEVKLIREIFRKRGYNKEVRPVVKKEDVVQVVFDLAYTQLLDLDEKNQVLVSNVWVRMRWYNELLKWNKDDFGGLESINIDSSKIWIPDIVLQNNAEEALGAGQLDLFNTKVILNYNGENQFYAPAILRSRCEINVEYFPFDDQKCQLSFLSLSYDKMRLNIKNKTSQADRIFYLESAEFELLSTKAENKEYYHGDYCVPYMNVVYTIHIRRKTLFYFNNLIGPCFLITMLCLFTFLLPPETGERITLVITTLLAMTVFMLTIAEKTPIASKATPLVTKFFFSSMVIIGLSLIATCIVLNLYENRNSRSTAPRILRVILFEYVAPFLYVNFNKDLLRSNNILYQVKQGNMKTQNGHLSKPFLSNRAQTWCTIPQSQNHILSVPKCIINGIKVLADRAKKRNEEEFKSEEWVTIAKIFDRLFFIVFLFTIVLSGVFIYSNRS
ncbi:neuronal acetylcholine receptor subunit alpha-10 isoform X1 [Hydra vulgaris]|uniref:neuronal acetylcholine receptor subunit alpha-10 isoform X1 n=1 Tax=Hydra vulgaris TaxID=6087 RepID=UPI001F5F5603|nr:neuronal acetylcholine receptor subunit alpha-10 isoform X2 [Hydra vulgaris]